MINYEISREKDEKLFYLSGIDQSCPSHFHKKLEILYVDEGDKKIITNNKMIVLHEGDLFIADSYVIHAYLDSRNSTQTCIVFPNMYLTDYFNAYGNKLLSGNVITDKEFTSELLPIIRSLKDENRNNLVTQGCVDLLLGKIVDKLGVSEKEYKYDVGIIGDIITYIDEHYAEEITLDTLANHFGYSKYYFSRLFNSCMGTSITDYISIIRADKVLEMLKNSDVTISEAIFSSGFSSIPTFYRVLKKNYVYKKIEDLLV